MYTAGIPKSCLSSIYFLLLFRYMNKWFIYTKKADFAKISEDFHISPILARIIRNRDIISYEEIERFLHPDLSQMYDPFLMKGMDEGISIMHDHISRNKKIRIVGDYDTDGVCSSYILSTYFKNLGADIDVRLPDRMSDGYGMNESMVLQAGEDGVSLIITCDNGISCIGPVHLADEMGIKTIITDHHEPPDVLPEADVIIDAKQNGCNYPFKDICGAAVTYKFIQAYSIKYKTNNDALMDMLMQFAGLATIADIVPLKDENRIFAYQGIERLKTTDNPGLLNLMQVKGLDKDRINAANIGFVIAPCINSAGRLKNASISYDLLCEKHNEKALSIAAELSDLNEERKRLTIQQTSAALNILEKKKEKQQLPKLLIIYLPDAHESVAGIIAGRIKDEYSRPAFVITSSKEGLKGSGRSIPSYNMVAGLQNAPDLFLKYGGHPMACGFTLKLCGTEEETVERFSDMMNAGCTLEDDDLNQKIWIDMQLPFKYVSQSLVDELKLLEPFGIGNDKPVFAGKNIKVNSVCVLGSNQNVLKMNLEDKEGYILDGIMFGSHDTIENKYSEAKDAQLVNILFYPDINDFRGRKTPQLIIQDFMVV